MNKEIREIVKQINIQCDDDWGLTDYDKTINELTFDLFILIDDLIPHEG